MRQKKSFSRGLPRFALVVALVATLCTGCGGGDTVVSTVAANISQPPPANISVPPLANGVTIEFRTPDQATTVTVANPTAPAAFQGVGVNLVGANDLRHVPCVAKPGATPCPVPGPNPAVSATSVRAAINLPFTADGSYVLRSQKCLPFVLSTDLIDYNDPAKTNGFFDTYAQTKIYTTSNCTDTPQSIADRYGLASDNSVHCSTNYAGACLIMDVATKHLDWVQVYFAVPKDLAIPSRSSDLAALEAAQLVYQTALGAPPKFVELRNEPDNDAIRAPAYSQFLAAFNNVLPRLIDQRLLSGQSTPEQTARLAVLRSVQVVGPGLTSAYKLDYIGDPLSSLPKDPANADLWSTLWFKADGSLSPQQVAQQFFQDAVAQKLLLSSHVYDEKHVLADGRTTLDALAGLKNFFRVRNQFQPTAPSPVMLTEMAESVEHDAQTSDYMAYCASHSPTSACGAPGIKDSADGFAYGYPQCLAGTGTQVFKLADYAAIADMCHNQAATLNRNIINFANQGVVSELVWAATPTPTTTRHGLLTKAGLPTLMNAGTEPLFKALSTLGYTTVYPASWHAPFDNTTVDAVAVLSTAPPSPPAPGQPVAARMALANTDSIARAYALDFGSTPFAQFTQVSWASTIGGLADKYAGTAIETTDPVVLKLPAGTTFGSDGRRLVITLPPRSAVTLDLKR